MQKLSYLDSFGISRGRLFILLTSPELREEMESLK